MNFEEFIGWVVIGKWDGWWFWFFGGGVGDSCWFGGDGEDCGEIMMFWIEFGGGRWKVNEVF